MNARIRIPPTAVSGTADGPAGFLLNEIYRTPASGIEVSIEES